MTEYARKLLGMMPKSELIDIMINHDNCHLRLNDVLRHFESRHSDALWEKYLKIKKRKGAVAAEPAFKEWRAFYVLRCKGHGWQLP